MKLSLVFLFVGVLHISASVYSQGSKVSINMKDVPLRTVLNELEKVTHCTFFYNEDFIDLNKPVSLKVTDSDMDNLLKVLFEGTGLTYQMQDKMIVVAPAKFQQKITVTGKITDAKTGDPLGGVSVLEKGTNNGVISDASGNYSITVSDSKSVLLFSFLGFNKEEIAIEGRTQVSVSLVENVTALNEVVVTALGIKREKKALGYAVQEVNGQSLKEARDNNVANTLAGKVSGLVVTQAGTGGGSSRITIRGNSSLTNNNQPLIVVDGVPIDNFVGGTDDRWGNRALDYGSSMSDISPDDIENISVLKGPSAAALYGSRAGAGVIMITTKKGSTRKGIGITLNSNTVLEKSSKYIDMQNTYGQGNGGAFVSNGLASWGPKMTGQSITDWTGQTRPFSPGDNNITDFLRTGIATTNSIEFTAGNEKVTFRGSGSYLASSGVIPNNRLNRTTINLRSTANLTDKLSVDVKVNYILTIGANRPKLANDPDNIFLNYVNMPRSIHYSDLTNWKRPDGQPTRWDYDASGKVTNGGYILNPYWTVYNNLNADKRDRIIGMGTLQYKFTKELDVKVRHGVDFWLNDAWDRLGTGTPYWQPTGDYRIQKSGVREDNTEAFLTYSNASTTHNRVSLTVSLGSSYMKRETNYTQVATNGLVIPDFYAISNAAAVSSVDNPSKMAISSVFGTAQIGYNNWAYLDVTARNDWSSTLPSNNWSYFYPSVGLSWVITDMFKSMGGGLPEAISFAKLRGSFAEVGNGTLPYATQMTFILNQMTAAAKGALPPSTLPLADLKPEKIKSLEFGADLRFFNDRIGIDVSYYKKNATNQIISLTVPPATGYNYKQINAGNIQNSGIELTLNLTPVKLGNRFQWDLSLNYNNNKNKIIALDPNQKTFTLSPVGSILQVVAVEGGIYGDLYGTSYTRDNNGKIVVGADGLPIVNNTPTKLGNYLPDWTGGLSNTFTFKNLSLNFLVDIRKGGNIYSGTLANAYSSGTAAGTTAYRDGGLVVDGVYADGTKNTTAINAQTYWGTVSGIQEAWIRDASFVRLREVALGYFLPKSLIAKTPFKSVKISAVGRNLWLINSHLEGIDPESAFSTGNAQGMEMGSTPGMKTYGFNINVEF